MRTKTLIPVLAVGALVVAACASDPVRPPSPASVAVAPDSVDLVLLDMIQLSAIVRDAQGQVLPDYPVTWGTSNPGLAIIDASGRVRGVGRGPATITAATSGATGIARVVVVAPVTFIEVAPTTATVRTGDTLRLRLTLRSIDSGPPTDSTLVWTSSDTLIAAVASTGLVTARQPGLARVTATTPFHLQAMSSITVQGPQ